MKAAMLWILGILFLAGLSFAQFQGVEATLSQCEKKCCTDNNGTWSDADQYCDISGADYVAYSKCDNNCYESARSNLEEMGGRPSLCCVPALVLLGLVGATLFSRDT